MVFGLFKKKRKEESKDTEEQEDVLGICPICNNPVRKSEPHKVLVFQGQRMVFHKKCFKQMKKVATQLFKGGQISF